MTHEEELMLREYLRMDAQNFEDWLRSTRDGSEDGEREYKGVLGEALAYGRGFTAARRRIRMRAIRWILCRIGRHQYTGRVA